MSKQSVVEEQVAAVTHTHTHTADASTEEVRMLQPTKRCSGTRLAYNAAGGCATGLDRHKLEEQELQRDLTGAVSRNKRCSQRDPAGASRKGTV